MVLYLGWSTLWLRTEEDNDGCCRYDRSVGPVAGACGRTVEMQLASRPRKLTTSVDDSEMSLDDSEMSLNTGNTLASKHFVHSPSEVTQDTHDRSERRYEDHYERRHDDDRRDRRHDEKRYDRRYEERREYRSRASGYSRERQVSSSRRRSAREHMKLHTRS